MSHENVIKARVFVSCSQKGEEEKTIAHKIERELVNLGFEPYVAQTEHRKRNQEYLKFSKGC